MVWESSEECRAGKKAGRESSEPVGFLGLLVTVPAGAGRGRQGVELPLRVGGIERDFDRGGLEQLGEVLASGREV